MTQPARVKLTSISLSRLGSVCTEIMNIGEKAGIKIKGPIPLPVGAAQKLMKNGK